MGILSKYIVAVGNGPVPSGSAVKIDDASFVMRFNSPHHPPAEAGRRTDALCAVNVGDHLRRWLKGDYLSSFYFSQAARIVLPWHPNAVKRLRIPLPLTRRLKGQKEHWTIEAVRTFVDHGKGVEILAEQIVLESYRELGLPLSAQPAMPSTGFVGIKHLLSMFPEQEIHLFGFTWHGWSGHPWEKEKAWLLSHPQICVRGQ